MPLQALRELTGCPGSPSAPPPLPPGVPANLLRRSVAFTSPTPRFLPSLQELPLLKRILTWRPEEGVNELGFYGWFGNALNSEDSTFRNATPRGGAPALARPRALLALALAGHGGGRAQGVGGGGRLARSRAAPLHSPPACRVSLASCTTVGFDI